MSPRFPGCVCVSSCLLIQEELCWVQLDTAVYWLRRYPGSHHAGHCASACNSRDCEFFPTANLTLIIIITIPSKNSRPPIIGVPVCCNSTYTVHVASLLSKCFIFSFVRHTRTDGGCVVHISQYQSSC